MTSGGLVELRGLLPGAEVGQRIPPAQATKLPADTLAAGRVPAGLHLALQGTAAAIRLSVVLGDATPTPSPRAGSGFAVWIDGSCVSRAEAITGTVEIALPVRHRDDVVRIYLPEDRVVDVVDAEAVSGELWPVPRGPRWVVYGDSIAQGWSVSTPGGAWPCIAGHELGLDVINLGFAGSARGELMAAMAVVDSEADVVSLAWGTNAWTSVPTDSRQIAETMRLFLATLRQGLPEVPVVVLSPIVRPDAETTTNRFGASLLDLREALESAVVGFAEENHDQLLTLVPGVTLLAEDLLVDGVHPGDEGHRVLASCIAPVVGRALGLDRY